MSELRFHRALRLCDKTSIQNIFRSGKKNRSPELTLFFYPNQLLHPRICISVSKKNIPKAHDRNQIKRIARESFRLKQHQLPKYDIVVVIYKPAGLLDKKQLRQSMDKQWQKFV